MKTKLAFAAFAAIVSATACTPLQALSHGGNAPYHCKVTWPKDPNGPAACIGNDPVFMPPDWVQNNSPVPYPNGSPQDPTKH